MSKNNLSIQRKRASRLAAVQAIYQSIVMKEPLRAARRSDAITQQWRDEQHHSEGEWGADNLPEEALLNRLLEGVEAHLAEIDATIESAMRENWKLARMPAITVAILRAAVYELLYQHDLNESIIVDEYVSMAADYIDDAEVDFVHATLRTLGTKARQSQA